MECKTCKKCHGISGVLSGLSLVSAVLAALVSIFNWDLWLAGTQWILIAILLAIYAMCAREHNK